MSDFFSRAYPLEDISVDKAGDGRTVTAYAAVFDTDAEVRDVQGHYIEQIDRAAFNRTIDHNGTNVGVFYNHGLTLHGTPSDRGSVPLGKAVEIRTDAKGVLTRTRYGKTPLADEVLDMIHEGAITGQSFSGRIIRSDRRMPRGGFRPGPDGELVRVRRMELGLKEYGPTPLPTYASADIVGVRSLVDRLTNLSDDEREELIRALQQSGTPILDSPADGTPDLGRATDDPPANSASTRLGHSFLSLRREAREKGVL